MLLCISMHALHSRKTRMLLESMMWSLLIQVVLHLQLLILRLAIPFLKTNYNQILLNSITIQFYSQVMLLLLIFIIEIAIPTLYDWIDIWIFLSFSSGWTHSSCSFFWFIPSSFVAMILYSLFFLGNCLVSCSVVHPKICNVPQVKVITSSFHSHRYRIEQSDRILQVFPLRVSREWSWRE